MDKTLVGIIAAIGAVAAVAPAQAEISSSELSRAMEASSYAELIRPIPNAVALLRVADDQQPVSEEAGVQLAQFHHHHHHHHHYRRHYHHHHHHHYY